MRFRNGFLLSGIGRFAATDDQRVVNGLLAVELDDRFRGHPQGPGQSD
jgi:hypothetical protein